MSLGPGALPSAAPWAGMSMHWEAVKEKVAVSRVLNLQMILEKMCPNGSFGREPDLPFERRRLRPPG